MKICIYALLSPTNLREITQICFSYLNPNLTISSLPAWQKHWYQWRWDHSQTTIQPFLKIKKKIIKFKLVLLWAQLTKIYPTSVQPISITKILLIVPTKNERDPPLFTSKLLIKFQNILRNTTQVIIRHRVQILFSVISSPITLERQKWKSSKMKGILLSSPVSCC